MTDTGYHLSLPTGTRIEEYQLVSVLGQGSFGITYLAEDTNLGARLAIKEYLPGDWAFRDATQTVRPKSTNLSESFERGQDAFLKEARILARVAHPNIVKVRRFFRAHGTAYIAMDFVKGRSLGDIWNQDYRAGGYPSAALKQLLITMLEGLSALHEAGIIHRDIKPGNIVIEPNGNPILVDFGAARNYDRTVMQGMTVIVTPGYAPIEQYSDDGEQGPFTDLYAIGALAYRAITGQPPDPPYKRLGRNSSASASVAGAGKYPAGLLSAIDWALEVQPHDRPQSAAALLARLREAPDETPTAVADEPTQVLSDKTQIIESSRWRGANAPKDGSVSPAEPSSRRVREPVSSPQSQPETPKPASDAPIPVPAAAQDAITPVAGGEIRPPAGDEIKRRPARMPLVLASIAMLALVGAAAAYFVAPNVFRGGTTAAPTAADDAQQRAAEAAKQAAEAQAAAEAAKLKAEQEAAEAARQAAAKAEAERQAAAAAQLKAEQDAAEAARQEAERAAAAKEEADRQAAEAAKAKAEQEAAEAARQEAARQAAAKAEADRQAAAAAKAKAEQEASAPANANLDPEAAEAARQEAASAAAAKAEAAGQAGSAIKTKTEQDAARAAAKREADRQAAAAAKLKAQQQAAALARLRAQQEAGGFDAARQLLGPQGSAGAGALGVPSVRPIDPRCTTILQNTSLMGALSDADRLYLRDHCH